MTVFEPPGAIVPRLQVKLGPPEQPVPVTVPCVKPAGHVSVSVTLVASDGPAFETEIVYV